MLLKAIDASLISDPKNISAKRAEEVFTKEHRELSQSIWHLINALNSKGRTIDIS